MVKRLSESADACVPICCHRACCVALSASPPFVHAGPIATHRQPLQDAHADEWARGGRGGAPGGGRTRGGSGRGRGRRGRRNKRARPMRARMQAGEEGGGGSPHSGLFCESKGRACGGRAKKTTGVRSGGGVSERTLSLSLSPLLSSEVAPPSFSLSPRTRTRPRCHDRHRAGHHVRRGPRGHGERETERARGEARTRNSGVCFRARHRLPSPSLSLTPPPPLPSPPLPLSRTQVHDCQLDYYGRRLATCSSDRTIKVREGRGRARGSMPSRPPARPPARPLSSLLTTKKLITLHPRPPSLSLSSPNL